MTFPITTSVTCGVLLVLQMVLALTTSGARGRHATWIGDGGHEPLLRTVRRHGNLAENAGIFVGGFTLLELSRAHPGLLTGLCAAFILVRILHALGLSRENTNNGLRAAGGVGTYLVGFALGAALLQVSAAGLGAGPRQ